MRNRIDISVLREVTNRIFDFIEQDLQMKSVELTQELYWSVPSQTLYDLTPQPTELDCGSLTDDYEFVVSALRSKSAIPLDLIHVAPLLQALSQAVPSYKPPRKKAGDSADGN